MFITKIKFSLAASVMVICFVILAQIIPVSEDVDEQFYTIQASDLLLYMVVMGFLILLLGMLADRYVYRLNKQHMTEHLEIYRATVWASHHVLNNFLNKLYLIQYRASENGKFTEEMADSMGKMIQEAAGQLLELSRVEPITAEGIRESVAPK